MLSVTKVKKLSDSPPAANSPVEAGELIFNRSQLLSLEDLLNLLSTYNLSL